MGVPLRERRKHMLRTEILDAARTLAAEKGYAAMSMDELAARVGVSKPTLYSLFSTKDEIIIAAAMMHVERLMAVIEENKDNRTPLERLALVLRTAIEIQIEKGTSGSQLWIPEIFDLLRTHPVSSMGLQRVHQALISLVQDAIDQGDIDPVFDSATIIRAHFAFAHAACLAPVGLCGEVNPETIAEALTEIFVRGVRAQPVYSRTVTSLETS